MAIRNLSPATQQSYVHAVSRFSRYFGRSPDRLGLEDVRAYQVHLASKGVAWASVNQAVCALRFFYGVTLGEQTIPERIAYAREPRKLPVVLSADEVVRFLESVSSLKARVALTTAYAAGLRVSEVAALKVHRLRLSTPSSRCAAGPHAPRLVRSDLARLSLTRFVVVAAQRPRMPAAERANPSNIASRRLPGALSAHQFDVAVDLSP